MKKIVSIFMAMTLMVSMTACGTPKSSAGDNMISSSGQITQESSSQIGDFTPEKPDSQDNIDAGASSGEAANSSSSTASSSSEASKPSSSSQALKPDPETVVASSGEAPKPSSSSTAPSSSEALKPDPETVVASSGEAPKPSYTSEVSSLPEDEPVVNNMSSPVKIDGEVRAVWISYLELDRLLQIQPQKTFEKNMETVFKNVKNANMNTVIVQVRPYADAYYKSAYFPWSYKITGTEGKDPGFDPLEIMVRLAHKEGLRIEAWINPYRVRVDVKSEPLSSGNQAKKWLDEGHDGAIAYGKGVYYNPGNADARKLIVNGVKEIVENYDVDGIHFDDYFYPTPAADFDAKTYNAYKKTGGTMSLGDWRRENVNILVKDVYAAIKAIDPNVVFGISPQGNMENNYNAQFIDVKKWLSTPGYIDYICPQVYFGFKNQGYPFDTTVKTFNDMIKVDGIDLYVGIAPYKLGTTDTWAGNGKDEWKNTTDILKRMVEFSRTNSQYKGFVMYRYDSMFKPADAYKAQVNKEMQNLQGILD